LTVLLTILSNRQKKSGGKTLFYRAGGDCLALPFRPEDHLCVAEAGDQFVAPVGAVVYRGIPYLSCASCMDRARFAHEQTFARRAHEVALQFNRREVLRTFGEAGDTAVAARRVG